MHTLIGRLRSVLPASLALALLGCTELPYYSQAVSGQWQLLSLRYPLEEVIADPVTPPALRQRLETARALRDFASTELALPENGSYRSYADLQRPYVVKNLFAAPELSLQPRQWCFPVLGCVSYRGYFDTLAAQQLADALREGGDDVYLANVPAYSTLGWFDDPLLNTFLNWPTGRLAELLFHELAHQRLYVANDSPFNESFATAVGGLGARLWLERHGTSADKEAYAAYMRQRENFMALVLAARDDLATLYESSQSDAVKREGKRRRLADLQAHYQILKRKWGDYPGYDHWFAQDLNNAKLAALNTYTYYVPAFETLFAQQGRNFAAFYQAAKAIGDLPPAARQARLQTLLSLSATGE